MALDPQPYKQILDKIIFQASANTSKYSLLIEGPEELDIIGRKLGKDGLIEIVKIGLISSMNSYIEETQDGEPWIPEDIHDDYYLEYKIYDLEGIKKLRSELNSETFINPLIEMNVLEYGTTPLNQIGDFIIYSSGAITFKESPLALEPRLQDIMILFLRKANSIVTFDDMKEVLRRENYVPPSQASITKYVNELKKNVSELPVSITSTTNIGYTLTYHH